MKKKILTILIAILTVCACMFSLLACEENEPPHTHTFDKQIVNDNFKASSATCTQKSKYYYSCACGERGVETFESGAVLGHSYTNYTYNEDATCENDGTETACCNNGCGTNNNRIKENSALGHDYGEIAYFWNNDKCTATRTCSIDNSHVETETVTAEYIKDTNATCVTAETGHYKAVFTNSAFEEQNTLPNTVTKGEELGHSYESVVTDPTCEDKGYTTYTCHCGDSYIDNYVNALGHTEVIDKAVAPTCTETGLTEGKHCSECKKVFVAQEVVKASGHSYESVVTDPTCEDKGYTTYTCHCGDSYIDDYVNALGHTEVIDKAVAPTCTETGLTEGKHCSECKKVLVAQETVDALGHNFVDGVCNQCGEHVLIFALSEDESYYIVTGTRSDSISEIIIPSEFCEKPVKEIGNSAFEGHKTLKVVNVPESVTKISAYAFYNSGVEKIYLANAIDWNSPTYTFTFDAVVDEVTILTYSFEKPENVANALRGYVILATYGEHRGETDEMGKDIPTYNYTNFAWYEQDWTKNEHSFKSVVVNPTCTEQGYTTYTCQCGYSYIDNYVDALGHTEVIDKAVAPTCTETGLTEGKHCSVCKEVLVAQEVVKEKGHSYSLVDNKDGTHTKICDNDNNHIITENCGWEYISNNDGTKTATCECGSKNVLIDESVFIVENGKLTGITEYGKTLKKLVILDSVTSIKAGALKGCDVLEEITLPFIGASQTANSGYNQVFGYIFGYEVTQAMSIVNPEVAAGAIRQYKGDVPGGPSLKNFYDYYVPKTLRKVTVKADGVLKYGFENCNMLNTVEIVGAVTTIEANLFAGCKELKDLILPSTVSTISNDAFGSCNSLQNVYYYGSPEEFLSITVGSNNTNFTNATCYYYVVNQEDVPNDGGNYWHYNENGEIVVWDINQ